MELATFEPGFLSGDGPLDNTSEGRDTFPLSINCQMKVANFEGNFEGKE
jgi:hypothetical protein